MPRYDVYRNPNPRTRAHNPPRTLYPLFGVEGREMVMLTPLVAGVRMAAIGERVASLGDEGSTILAALDLVLTGA